MARAHLREVIRGTNGLTIQNARANFYVKGTSTSMSAWNAEIGGSSITFKLSNDQGEVEAWFDLPGQIDIEVTTNSGAALYSVNRSPAYFSTFRETISVGETPTSPPVDDLTTVPSLRTLGFGAQQAFPGDVDPSTRIPSGTYADFDRTNDALAYPNAVFLRSTGDDAEIGSAAGLPVATLARALTLAGSTPTRVVVLDNVAVPANATVPSTVSLVFGRNGSLRPASGTTTTISGAVSAGRWRIFDTGAGGTITFASTAPVDTVYPEWFGVVGNGTTVALAAWNATFTAAAACKAVVSGSPSASYAFSSQVTLPANTRWDLGGSTVKQVNVSTASPMFVVGAGSRLYNGSIDCNSLVTGTCVYVNNVTKVTLRDLTITDPARVASNLVQVAGTSADVLVERCWFDGCLTGIRITGTSRRVKVRYCDTRNTKNQGIYVVGTGGVSPQDIDIEGNYCTDLDTSGAIRCFIQASGDTTNRIRNLTIKGNIVIGPGLSFTDPGAAKGSADQITCVYVDGLHVVDNVSLYGGDVGISGTQNLNVTYTGNVCLYNDSCGIFVASAAGASTGFVVTGNTCNNNGQSRQGDRPDWAAAGIGIWLADRAVVTGNTCTDTQVVKTQRYGITYKFSTDVRFGTNMLEGNSLGRLLNDGGNTRCGYILDDGVQFTSTGSLLKKHLTTAPVLDWPSIAANSTSDLTTTVTGAVVGDKATAHPNSVLESGLIVGAAVVSATDTVTIRLANVTTGAIDPANRTWRVMVWGH